MILCSPSCGIAPNSRSGGEVLERELVTALHRGGDDPHVLLARHQAVPPDLTIERVRCGRGLRGAYLLALAMVPAVWRCYRAHQFDVLRAHSAKHLGSACEIASRLTGRPWVAHIQHVDQPSGIEGWALHKAARVITISEFSKRQVVQTYGIRAEKIAVIPPGVDHSYFKPQPVGIAPGRHLLFVGGLKRRKRPMMLLDILERVPGARLTVVGDGPLRRRFLDQVQQRGLDGRVTVWTDIRDWQRPAFYRDADVFLFPSALEGFGMPVLEAMACGVPVVASKAGALPELVPGCETVEEMIHVVRFLLENPDAARDLGRVNYQASLAYSWERCAKDVRRVCEEVAG